MTASTTWRQVPDQVPGLQSLKDRARSEIEARRDELISLSHRIHANPEVSWQEHQAAGWVAEVLRKGEFDVKVGAYQVPTSVEASYGDSDLTVAICAEYDSLPGVGHACGHNMIAAAGVGAALGLAPVAGAAGLRIKLLGTPAEEHGGGKVAMLMDGAWEDVDFSMMAHGATGEDRSAAAVDLTACDRFEVIFSGRTAHAASSPAMGINAGAAATLALTAIALLRQHVNHNANMNAFVSVGGEATNVIPDRTVVQVEVRADDLPLWRDLKRRVLACFDGAATATGCQWDWAPTEHPYAPVKTDQTLARLWDANLTALGRTLTAPPLRGGSTDMGNVSQVVPSIHPMVSFLGESAIPHNPEFTLAAVSRAADDAILDAAIAMAWTTLDVAATPNIRQEFRQRTAERMEGATRQSLQA